MFEILPAGHGLGGGLMAIAPLPDAAWLQEPPRPALALVQPAPSGGLGTRRARTARRWRRAVPLCVLAGLLGLLAAPIEAIAGTPAHPASPLTPGATYVVRPGDTLTSIARRLAPGSDPSVLVAAMAEATGSRAVVPGEHIVLP